MTGSVTAIIRNSGPTTIFIGGATVSATTGFEVPTGGIIDVELIAGDLLYGITAAGTQEVQTVKLMS